MLEFQPILPKSIPLRVSQEQINVSELLTVKRANQWMIEARDKPVPRPLFGDLWYEGETVIFFGDTGSGKSILSVQAANDITRGETSISVITVSPAPSIVLYNDYELSDIQFRGRYSSNGNDYLWDSQFLRAHLNPDFLDVNNFDNQLFEAIETHVVKNHVKVLIVDNITYLRTQSTEKGNEALQLMRRLVELKKKHSLSMMIIAHTPKRAMYSPLSINDLAGSKQLSNFADSIFCIGRSTLGNDYRYLKQLKARSCPELEEVITLRLSKDHNFLGFQFVSHDPESVHLKVRDDNMKELDLDILELHRSDPELSYQGIASQLGTNKMKVCRVVKQQS